VKINDEFEITWDGYSWRVSRTVSVKKRGGGDGTKKIYTWHPSIEMACVSILENQIEKCESLQEVIDTIREAKKEILESYEQ